MPRHVNCSTIVAHNYDLPFAEARLFFIGLNQLPQAVLWRNLNGVITFLLSFCFLTHSGFVREAALRTAPGFTPGVRGPVSFWALARLAASSAGVRVGDLRSDIPSFCWRQPGRPRSEPPFAY